MAKPIPADPQFNVGETVRYEDRHGRLQTGEVLRIEASWEGYGRNPEGRPPLVIYTLRHPTYANNRMHAGVEDIHGAA